MTSKKRNFDLSTFWSREMGDGGPPELMRQDIGIEAESFREALEIARQKYPGREVSWRQIAARRAQ